jgi:hypothetical protein
MRVRTTLAKLHGLLAGSAIALTCLQVSPVWSQSRCIDCVTKLTLSESERRCVKQNLDNAAQRTEDPITLFKIGCDESVGGAQRSEPLILVPAEKQKSERALPTPSKSKATMREITLRIQRSKLACFKRQLENSRPGPVEINCQR